MRMRGRNDDPARSVLELEREDEADVASDASQADPSLRLLAVLALRRRLRVGRLVKADLAHAGAAQLVRPPRNHERMLLVGVA